VTADLSPWLSRAQARRLSLPSRFAVVACRLALDQTRIDPSELEGEATAVYLATAFGTVRYAEELIKTILTTGPTAASPFYFSESVANAPAAQVAIAFGAKGSNMAITQREAGALLALGDGANEILSGRAQNAFVGGVDEINPLVHGVLDRLRAITTGKPRPLDQRRDGFLASEGATILLLEEAQQALGRGAHPLAFVLCSGGGFDPTATSWTWGTGGESLARRLRRGLERHQVPLEDIELVVCGASGSVKGDALEASVLTHLWRGQPLPPVVAPKGVTGEFAGGHLGAAVLASGGAPMALPDGYDHPDSSLGLALAVLKRRQPTGLTLVTTTAAGGAFAWAIMAPD
jgi:3-oxoacyl-[acyl-carrier-protein] synthase II